MQPRRGTDKMKILAIDDLVKRVNNLKGQGRKIVHCHGCFDLMHPGHIKYFQAAKKMGDILLVTVTPDIYVDKGPGRPVFNEGLRAESIAALECVDFVAINQWPTAEETLRLLRPDIYVKGQEFEKLQDRTGKIQKEAAVAKEIGARLCFTHGAVFSSTALINSHPEIIENFLNIYSQEVKGFLKDFSKKYNFSEIKEKINSLSGLRVMLVGDGIIDEYHYCEALGKSAKANLVVNKYLGHEVFAGGAFAIANHLSGLCSEIELVSLLGNDPAREDFVRKSLKPNIKSRFFYRQDSPTVTKKRYINQYLNQKMFEVNFLDESYISARLESEVVKYLKASLPRYDLVLVSDFGHGFITDKVIQVIERLAVKFAVNTQINAANAGYNMITKYHKPAYVCLDEPELRLAAQERFADIECVAKKVLKNAGADCLIVTLGKKGSLGINKNKELNRTPVFSSKVIDTVGAGDAFFAFTAPCVAQNMPLDLVSFIGNAVGALAVQIVCNKKPVEKYELFEFIHTLLRR
ncbi:MAG: PfkB family carbohydrate kinase [Candidatus Omnitrophota bacterium]|nr:PfkB family carbohydrate kinase [Candidatus Omnitrophota bacterium]